MTSAAVAANVEAILGLDDRPRFRPRLQRAAGSRGASALPGATIRKVPNTTNPPGDWTVVDLAQYYDISPLTQASTATQHAGIVTLASFTPSDAFAYWNGLGLPVKNNRLKIVDIEGPRRAQRRLGVRRDDARRAAVGRRRARAKIIVYQAPNTDRLSSTPSCGP